VKNGLCTSTMRPFISGAVRSSESDTGECSRWLRDHIRNGVVSGSRVLREKNILVRDIWTVLPLMFEQIPVLLHLNTVNTSSVSFYIDLAEVECMWRSKH
jgi:hypothetical protein